MAKSAPQLERDIRTRLLKCKVSARGLWHEMRYLIETESDRPGELHRHGAPISAGQLAHEAGCPSKKVTPLLEQLKTVGLIEFSNTGTIYSPLLSRISHKRERLADRQKRHRERKGALHNPGRNAPSDARVTPVVSSPPAPASLSPPTTPSYSPPSPPSPSVADGCADGPPPQNGAKSRKKPTGPFHEVVGYFTSKWGEKYGREYPFRAMDGKKVKELLNATGGCIEDATAAIDRFLADDDQFLHGHSLSMLTSGRNLTRYLTDSTDPFDPAIQAKRVAQLLKAGKL